MKVKTYSKLSASQARDMLYTRYLVGFRDLTDKGMQHGMSFDQAYDRVSGLCLQWILQGCSLLQVQYKLDEYTFSRKELK